MKHIPSNDVENEITHGARIISHVTTSTVVGICLGTITFLAALAVATYYCYYKKKYVEATDNKHRTRPHGIDQPLTLRRPKAVKSPGTGPLKKSPSPTNLKSPPGQTGKLGQSSINKRQIDKVQDVEKSQTQNGSSQEKRISTGTTTTEQKNSPSTSCGTTGGFYKYFVENEKNSASEKHVSQSEAKISSVIAEVNDNLLSKNDSKLGKLHFSLLHDPEKNALMVTIVKCSDLPLTPKTDSNMTGMCDPYIKLQLLPDKQHKAKTRVVRKTTNPVYDEDFTFYGITNKQLSNTTLHFVVLSFDRYSRDDIIGEVVCNLNSVDLTSTEKAVSLTKEITPRHLKVRSQGRGELLASLCYQPASRRLTVVVLKARNLPKVDVTGLSDPYVKVYLLFNGQRIAKKKTHVKKRTLNPVFNESFVFEVPSIEGLENLSLEFIVLDWDRMTKNEVIGRVELGSHVKGSSSSSAVHHWLEVSNSPRRQIAEWHKLKA